jgi:hypothetical protein
MSDVQPDGDVHGPRDQVSPTLKVTKSAQEPRQSNQFPKLPTSLSRWSPQLAHRVGSLRRTDSVAIEGIADIGRSLAACRSDANDPSAT